MKVGGRVRVETPRLQYSHLMTYQKIEMVRRKTDKKNNARLRKQKERKNDKKNKLKLKKQKERSKKKRIRQKKK